MSNATRGYSFFGGNVSFVVVVVLREATPGRRVFLVSKIESLSLSLSRCASRVVFSQSHLCMMCDENPIEEN